MAVASRKQNVVRNIAAKIGAINMRGDAARCFIGEKL